MSDETSDIIKDEEVLEDSAIQIGAVTIENMSVTGDTPKMHPNAVLFKVQYPKDFKGERTMPDNSEHWVSKESANHFVSLKIGKIIK
jgi:hypothetical protein